MNERDRPMIRLDTGPNAAVYTVRFSNGVELGEFWRGDDGYYIFWPHGAGEGAWPAYLLRALADELDRLNADWDAQIRSDPAIGGDDPL